MKIGDLKHLYDVKNVELIIQNQTLKGENFAPVIAS